MKELLTINKMRRNKEEKQNGYSKITDLVLYEVSIPLNGLHHNIRYLISGHTPTGCDVFDLMTVQDVKQLGEEAIAQGRVESLNEFWEAYQLCLHRPELIKYKAIPKKTASKQLGFN